MRGVCKAYGLLHPRPALRDVWLRVSSGESFGLAGPNGAGKSTLIRILLGLAAPDEGEVRLFGQSPDDPELRRRVGFVPEAAELPPGASPRQLVRRWARLRGLPRAAEGSGLTTLERLGLGALIDRPAGQLSKGERQRTLLSLALLGEPELLILDEPTDGLDPLGRALVRELIAEQCAAGRTVFLNSHLLAETQRVCSRVCILHQGRLVREERLRAAAATDGPRATSVLRLDRLPEAEVLREAHARKAARDGDGPGVTVLVEHADAVALNGAVDRLRSTGALLLELTPLRADLEAVFLEAAETTEAALPARPLPRPDWAGEPLAPLRPPPPRPLRTLSAVRRVAGEIAAELASQKIGWMLLLFGALSMATLYRFVQSQLLASLAEASRAALRQVGAQELQTMTMQLASVSAQVLVWLLLGLSTLMSALFAVPLFDPRRTVLVYAQPVSRTDFALGVFSGVMSMGALSMLAYSAVLLGFFRWLGFPVSPRFMLIVLPAMLAFAPLFCIVLLATLVRRSGFFAGLCGLGALAGSAALAASDAVASGALSAATLLHAVTPKISELARVAGRLAEGGPLSLPPVISTGLADVALVLVLVTAVRRSDS